MVANCLVKTMMSLSDTPPPNPGILNPPPLLLALTEVTIIPCFLSRAITSSLFEATVSPFCSLPSLLLPAQAKVVVVAAISQLLFR